MLPVPDRKAKCQCGRIEHLRCPDLERFIFICNRCADNLDESIVNEVNSECNTNEEEDSNASSDFSLESPTPSMNNIFEDDSNSDNDGFSVINDDEDNNKYERIMGGTNQEVHSIQRNVLIDDIVIEREEFDHFLTHAVPDSL